MLSEDGHNVQLCLICLRHVGCCERHLSVHQICEERDVTTEAIQFGH